MYQHLEVEQRGPVATVWMNRPERHNAFDEHLISELTAAFQTLGASESVRALVLAGRGASFSAGADADWMRRAAAYEFDKNLDDARALAGMLRCIAETPKPTIARVHGAAIGGGMGLAAVCDIVIASTAAVFATSEVRLGLIPSAIGPYVVRAIGPRQAARYFLTGERLSAAVAERIGLAHAVVAPEALDDQIRQITDALSLGGPKAQQAAKELLAMVSHRTLNDELVEETAQRIALIRGTAEAREGIQAFMQKRPANWVARES
jgi:methylglutaconyl-CoA hydratase